MTRALRRVSFGHYQPKSRICGNFVVYSQNRKSNASAAALPQLPHTDCRARGSERAGGATREVQAGRDKAKVCQLLEHWAIALQHKVLIYSLGGRGIVGNNE